MESQAASLRFDYVSMFSRCAKILHDVSRGVIVRAATFGYQPFLDQRPDAPDMLLHILEKAEAARKAVVRNGGSTMFQVKAGGKV